VVGVDLAPQLLEVARRRAAAAGLELELHEMGAEQLRFADGAFDGATCAFALMFCPDPLQAVRELRRVVAGAGRVAVAVWDEPARNPYFTTLFQSVAQVFPPAPPPDPKAPGAFRLCSSQLAELLQAGGLADVQVASVPLELTFDSLDHHWQVTLDLAGGLRTRLALLSSEELGRLRSLVGQALQPFLRGDRVHITATALCGSGRAA
jgi:SAM-dependent methyltransferase